MSPRIALLSFYFTACRGKITSPMTTGQWTSSSSYRYSFSYLNRRSLKYGGAYARGGQGPGYNEYRRNFWTRNGFIERWTSHFSKKTGRHNVRGYFVHRFTRLQERSVSRNVQWFCYYLSGIISVLRYPNGPTINRNWTVCPGDKTIAICEQPNEIKSRVLFLDRYFVCKETILSMK